jgi:hypothetical protein
VLRPRRSVLVAAAALLTGPVLAAPVSSTFDAFSEGWIVTDFAGLGDYASVLGSYAVSWNGAGGNPGGHVAASDPSTGSYFFTAPAQYLGDQSTATGAALAFDLRTTHDTYGSDNVVVLIGNGGQIAVTPIPQPAVGVWQTFSVSLSAAGFRQNNLSGPVISPAAFAAILADLEGLHIPAEFANGLIETTQLDNVQLLPEPGALAALALLAPLAVRRGR